MSLTEATPAQFLEVAMEAAREAGDIVMAGFDNPKKISYKSEVDIVTETDKRSEAAIITRLRNHFPQHAIVAEEGGGGSTPASRYVWHVDPLDGTTNFAHGFPVFAVSIGLVEDGEPIAGVVLNPWTRELFSAARGAGAYLGQKPIHVSRVAKLAESLLGTGFPVRKRSANPNIHYYGEFTLRSHGIRRAGAAALDLCSVACGRFDGFWEFGLHSWDVAAGMIIITEAGGKISDFAGGPYHPGDHVILASNGLIHKEMEALAADIAERTAST
ncbi:MAG: inositol monophosphatase family protein [Candidatus Acidiferrales bacterium]